VSVTIDAAGHVVSLSVRTMISEGGRQVAVSVHTTYTAFNQVTKIDPA
jgi:hypothetical protein